MVTYKVTGGTFTGPIERLVGDVELTAIPQQQPMSAGDLRERLGVCTHPNFANTVWEHPDVWTESIADAGFGNIRGMVATNLPLVQQALTHAKANGLKWMAQVASCKQRTSDKLIMQRLAYIKDHVEDFIAIEGCNEPDLDGLTSDDVAYTVRVQRMIWKFVQDNALPVTVLAPPLRMPADAQLYIRFREAGIVGNYHVASVHHYFGDENVDLAELGARLDMIGSIFATNRFWISETGRTTALNAPPSQRPTVSQAAQAKLIVRDYLQILEEKRIEKVFLYEWLDDPNEAKDDTEKSFGTWQVKTTDPATWSPKQCLAPLTEFMSTLTNDSGDMPAPVDLEITKPEGVNHILVGKGDGTTTLWLWRPDAVVWWGDTNRDVDPAPVDVVIYSKYGETTVPVGGFATGVLVR